MVVDVGLVAAWAGSAVAIVTAGTAIAQARSAKRQAEAAIEQNQMAKERDRRAQAGKVAAWWNPDISPSQGPMLMNSSDLPVFTLVVRTAASMTGDSFHRIDVLTTAWATRQRQRGGVPERCRTNPQDLRSDSV